MPFETTRRTALFQDAALDADILRPLESGVVLRDAGRKETINNVAWLNVLYLLPGGEPALGWVLEAHCKESGATASAALLRALVEFFGDPPDNSALKVDTNIRRLGRYGDPAWLDLAGRINELSAVKENGLFLRPIDMRDARTIGDIVNKLRSKGPDLTSFENALPPAAGGDEDRAGERMDEAQPGAAPVDEDRLQERMFFFELGGEHTEGNEVKWGTAFDLTLKYSPPPPVVLARVRGEKLDKLVLSGGALQITVSPAGFEFEDGIAARIVKFKDGDMIGNATFRLRAPEKAAGPPPTSCGVTITFSVERRPIYEFFLPILLVDELSHAPYPDVLVDLSPDDLARPAAGKSPDVLVYMYNDDPWRLQWTANGFDPTPEDITSVKLASLQESYVRRILPDLKKIADAPVWALITETLGLPNPNAQAAARTCMTTAMSVGWKLYDRLCQDPSLKKLLQTIDALPNCARIQFKTTGIAFPWELLYPLEFNENGQPEENRDPKRLWGYRFQIESLLLTREGDHKPPQVMEQPGTLRVGMAMDTTIDAGWGRQPLPVKLQKDYFDANLQNRGDYFDGHESIRRMFETAYDASFIYCFCHGSQDQLVFGEQRNPISVDTVLSSRHYPRWPVIFLNACDAADVLPLSFYNFRTKFRDKKAFGQVAPSGPVPILFAAIFGRTVLEQYMERRPIGDILFDLRRQLVDRDVPLGLFYSLQCPLEVKAPRL